MSNDTAINRFSIKHAYQQVADTIAARIAADQYPYKLPGERDLAEEFGVSYITVRHAMAILRERGLILSIHGRGTFNASALTGDPSDPPPTGGVLLLLLYSHRQMLQQAPRTWPWEATASICRLVA